MKIELDMYQTLALAVLVLMLGKFLRERVRLLDKFCIPAPVIGGVLFAIFTCICYVTGVAEFAFDDTLKEVCMVMFFTSVGFQANLKVLKSGGRAMIVFLGVVIVLIVSQNFVAVGLAKLLGVDALVGLCTGSIPMVGGHGTAGAFGPVLEDFGIKGATTLCTAAATYGLIARLIGREKNARLVGRVLSRAERYGNYPCHRVVNRAGRTAPHWPEQQTLLEAEGVAFRANGTVDMARFLWRGV